MSLILIIYIRRYHFLITYLARVMMNKNFTISPYIMTVTLAAFLYEQKINVADNDITAICERLMKL